MNKLLNSKYGLLIFSLFCGTAYFLLIMTLVAQVNYSYLLGLFFFPAIVAGGALSIFKTIRSLQLAEDYPKIARLIGLHIFLIIFAVFFFGLTYLI